MSGEHVISSSGDLKDLLLLTNNSVLTPPENLEITENHSTPGTPGEILGFMMI